MEFWGKGRKNCGSYNETPSYFSKEKIVKTVKQIMNFISKHRVAFAILGTATVFAILNKRNANEIDKFLTEHGIDPSTFWSPEE